MQDSKGARQGWTVKPARAAWWWRYKSGWERGMDGKINPSMYVMYACVRPKTMGRGERWEAEPKPGAADEEEDCSRSASAFPFLWAEYCLRFLIVYASSRFPSLPPSPLFYPSLSSPVSRPPFRKYPA